MLGGWIVVDDERVIIVMLKPAATRAEVMGVPKLPEACLFIRSVGERKMRLVTYTQDDDVLDG